MPGVPKQEVSKGATVEFLAGPLEGFRGTLGFGSYYEDTYRWRVILHESKTEVFAKRDEFIIVRKWTGTSE